MTILALGLAWVTSIWNQPSRPGGDHPRERGLAGQMANVTSHLALCRRLLSHLIYQHHHQPQIDRRSPCQVDLIRSGPVSAEESTSWIESSESRAPTKANPAGSWSAKAMPCLGVTFLLVTSPPRPSSLRVESMFHRCMGSG